MNIKPRTARTNEANPKDHNGRAGRVTTAKHLGKTSAPKKVRPIVRKKNG